MKLVQAAGGTCYGYVCDLCDREDIYKKANIIKEEIGKVISFRSRYSIDYLIDTYVCVYIYM